MSHFLKVYLCFIFVMFVILSLHMTSLTRTGGVTIIIYNEADLQVVFRFFVAFHVTLQLTLKYFNCTLFCKYVESKNLAIIFSTHFFFFLKGVQTYSKNLLLIGIIMLRCSSLLFVPSDYLVFMNHFSNQKCIFTKPLASMRFSSLSEDKN